MALTPKNERFIQEYMVDLNATQAAVRAGYSPKSASRTAYQLLRRDDVRAAVDACVGERAARLQISQDRILEELTRIAFSDLREVATWGGGGLLLKGSDTLTPSQSATVAEVAESTTKTGSTTRIKRYDKVKAIELLMRHTGMLRDKVEQSGSLEISIVETPYDEDDSDED